MSKSIIEMNDAIEKLTDVIKIQRELVEDSGYMRGLYNGMVLAQSIMDGTDPEYIDEPSGGDK